MPPKEYSPGDTVFAKLRGYPWWPARVENDKEIPAKILKQKGKSKAAFYTVFFYGSRDYGFFGPDCIRPFDRAAVERDLKAKKFKTKDLQHAIRQALDPSLLKAEEEAEAAELEEESEEDAEEEEEEEEEEEKQEEASEEDAEEKEEKEEQEEVDEDEDEDELGEEEDIKPKRKERKKTTAKNSTAATDNTRKSTGNNKRTVKGESSKRTRGDDDSDTDSKRSRKSLSIEQEEDTEMRKASPGILRKSEEPVSTNDGAVDLEQFKKTLEYKKTYHDRHRLQKLIYEKRPGEIPKEDYQRISNILKEVEETNMTFDLLRHTKIGKVLKYGCGYKFENDEYNIKSRCVCLMKKWKSELTPRNVEQQNGPESSGGHN